YDTVEVEYEAWVGRVPVLHVGIERADVDAGVRVVHEVVGDLDASITRMADLPVIRNDWPGQTVRQHRELFQNALRPATANFAPHQVIDVVRNVLPRKGVLAVDVGAHTHQIGSQWTAHAPATFLVTNGWSSMGFGIPAALAAKLAHPDLPVVCVLGDGCFQMTCGEVAAARRQRLAIPFVVLNDRWLSLIKVKQERQGLPSYGTEVSPDGCLIPPAHYFGVRAVGVDNSAGLERELCRALSADSPTIIETAVDAAHYSQTVYD
ncbi:MAG: thiamine pyrophosphate-binding protein, partial [Planctomycetaceae bacterium]